jgi:hypothetical protein
MTLKTNFKFNKNPTFILAFCFVGLFFALPGYAQDIEARITLIQLNTSEARVLVEGRFLNPKTAAENKSVSFLQNYADVSNLGARIEDLSLVGEKGQKLEVRKLADGEFQTNEPPFSFAYKVKVGIPSNYASTAHVSWLFKDGGLLMLNDLLPQRNDGQPVSAHISFKLLDNWTITSTEATVSPNVYDVKDIGNAIFLVGAGYRERTAKIDKTDLNLAIAGEWQFSDDEALQMATGILQEQRKIFGEIPTPKVQVFLLPFPNKLNSPERWRAETRGATVTVLSGAIPYKSQALQRLHEQLRHELYHLWVPNALALSGNYDWFYEGFTIYQALRTGIQMNQIRFEDFLKTLSQAYNMSQNQNVSLIEMSNNRWTGISNSVYARGMVVAFLCDAALLRESKGKRSLSEIFRQLYEKHRKPNAPQNGNTAVLKVLKSYRELLPVIQNYIEGNSKIEWQAELNNFGIESVDNNSFAELKVMPALSGKQKDLLDKLGYNQWRKLLQKTK